VDNFAREDLLRQARIARTEFGMERLYEGVVGLIDYASALERQLELERSLAARAEET